MDESIFRAPKFESNKVNTAKAVPCKFECNIVRFNIRKGVVFCIQLGSVFERVAL